MDYPEVKVIGAGLAGTEAAWQIANAGVPVRLFEMRPSSSSPAHHTDEFAELVCSNSFGAISPNRAAGLLQAELRIFDSLIIKTADKFAVPAGGALAVDRSKFSKALTKELEKHPLIKIHREENHAMPSQSEIAVIATGPLTSKKLAKEMRLFTGIDSCHFYDAASPIILGESIDYDLVFKASRYDKGDPSYLNCPMSKLIYEKFQDELIKAEQVQLKEFEKESANFFEGCLPIEELARRGRETMRYGPLKSIGLWNPDWGDLQDKQNRLKKRPYAIVQLRKEDFDGKLLNLVGFQTNLKWSEQKRVFRMIPGLANAEFIRFGVMHRNTFIESPRLLLPTLQFIKQNNLFAAGQITGTEGYAAAAAGGLLAGLNASLLIKNKEPIIFPDETIIGSLMNYVSGNNKYFASHRNKSFQPMPASFGLIPNLEKRVRDKKMRYEAYKERSIKMIHEFKKIITSNLEERLSIHRI